MACCSFSYFLFYWRYDIRCKDNNNAIYHYVAGSRKHSAYIFNYRSVNIFTA